MQARPRVLVVGGGISGLVTAYLLSQGPPAQRPRVTLLETADRLGGKIRTIELAGHRVDLGPDAFLARSEPMRRLLAGLGLTGHVVGPATSGAYVYSGGRLRRLPAGMIFGVPERLTPLLRSRLLSPAGTVRAGLDLVLPRTRLPEDPSVGELLRPRFGEQAFDRLVEPLLGGVHAGRADLLSARSTVPEIEALARGNRSIYLALRRARLARERRAGRPLTTAAPTGLVTLDNGLGTLVDALAAHLVQAGVLVRTGVQAVRLERTEEGYRLALSAAGAPVDPVSADAVVLATPAYASAELLSELAPRAAAALREIDYVDVASVVLAYPRAAVTRRLDATGFLVPPGEGQLVVGCSWLTAKWGHLAHGPMILVRAQVGRAGDHRWMAHEDDALIAAVHSEVAPVLGVSCSPELAYVQRWPRALPQYAVGHERRLGQLQAELADLAGVYLTGAGYRGVGLAGCVAQAEQLAALVLGTLHPAPEPPAPEPPAPEPPAPEPPAPDRAREGAPT